MRLQRRGKLCGRNGPSDGNRDGTAEFPGSGDEVAAEPECAFRRAAGPNRLQIDTDGGKNGDVKDGQNAFREVLRLLKFERDTTEAEVQYTGAASALFANDGVGIRANHGDAFGFSLNGIGSRRYWRQWSLLGERTRGSGRSVSEVGGRFFRWTASRDRDGRGRHRRWNGRGLNRGVRRAVGGARVIGVLQAIEALISDAHQLIRLIAVLREIGNAMIHGHGEGELQGAQGFGKDCFNAAAESQGLSGIGLRKKESEFIAT